MPSLPLEDCRSGERQHPHPLPQAYYFSRSAKSQKTVPQRGDFRRHFLFCVQVIGDGDVRHGEADAMVNLDEQGHEQLGTESEHSCPEPVPNKQLIKGICCLRRKATEQT